MPVLNMHQLSSWLFQGCRVHVDWSVDLLSNQILIGWLVTRFSLINFPGLIRLFTAAGGTYHLWTPLIFHNFVRPNLIEAALIKQNIYPKLTDIKEAISVEQHEDFPPWPIHWRKVFFGALQPWTSCLLSNC